MNRIICCTIKTLKDKFLLPKIDLLLPFPVNLLSNSNNSMHEPPLHGPVNLNQPSNPGVLDICLNYLHGINLTGLRGLSPIKLEDLNLPPDLLDRLMESIGKSQHNITTASTTSHYSSVLMNSDETNKNKDDDEKHLNKTIKVQKSYQKMVESKILRDFTFDPSVLSLSGITRMDIPKLLVCSIKYITTSNLNCSEEGNDKNIQEYLEICDEKKLIVDLILTASKILYSPVKNDLASFANKLQINIAFDGKLYSAEILNTHKIQRLKIFEIFDYVNFVNDLTDPSSLKDQLKKQDHFNPYEMNNRNLPLPNESLFMFSLYMLEVIKLVSNKTSELLSIPQRVKLCDAINVIQYICLHKSKPFWDDPNVLLAKYFSFRFTKHEKKFYGTDSSHYVHNLISDILVTIGFDLTSVTPVISSANITSTKPIPPNGKKSEKSNILQSPRRKDGLIESSSSLETTNEKTYPDNFTKILDIEISVFGFIRSLWQLHLNAISSSPYTLWINYNYNILSSCIDNLSNDEENDMNNHIKSNRKISKKLKGDPIPKDKFREFILSISRRSIDLEVIDQAYYDAIDALESKQMKFQVFAHAVNDLLRCNHI